MTFGNSWLLLWWMTEADQRCSAKIGVLKKMQYSQVFSCEICQIFKNSYFEEHLQMAVSRMKKLRSWGRFDNYVTLKLPFLTQLPPSTYHHVLSRVCSREPSFVTSPLSINTPPPPSPPTFPIKNEILGFKKDRSRSKEISKISTSQKR